MVRASDLRFAVAGSPPGHDTAWLLISVTGDRLWRVTTRLTQPCIPPGSLNRVPASAGVTAGKSPLPGSRSAEVISRSAIPVCFTLL